MKKVTIIIPTYNAAPFIERAIDSILAQTYTDYEIFVIDDGSTDNTKTILEQYGNRITYILQSNQGVAIARNYGIMNSRSEYIAFLDSDDQWLPEKLKLQTRILEDNNNIGLVHSNDIRISEGGKILFIDNPQIKYLSGKINKYLLLRKASVKTSTVLLRRDCLEKVGLFDPYLSKLGVEDRDLWIRFTKYYNAYYIEKPHVKYLVRSESMSNQQKKMLEGRYYIVNKHYPPKNGIDIQRRKMLSAIHFELGDSLSWRGQPMNAMHEYIIACKYFPYNIKMCKNILKTLIKCLLYG